MTFFLDLDMQPSDGKYSHPWKISIDEEQSLLVTRMQSYTDGADLSADDKRTWRETGLVFQFEGNEWFRNTFVELKAWEQLGDDVWVGTHTISGTDKGYGVYTDTIIDMSRCTLGVDIAPEFMDPLTPEDTFTDDLLLGEQYYSGHKFDKTYTYNHKVYEQISVLDRQRAEAWRNKSGLREPLLNARGEDVDLYLFRWLTGDTPAIEEHGHSDAANMDREAPENSAWWAWSALNTLGCRTTAVNSHSPEFEEIPLHQWILVPLLGSTTGNPQFELAMRVSSTKVGRIRPGSSVVVVPWDNWASALPPASQVLIRVPSNASIIEPARPITHRIAVGYLVVSLMCAAACSVLLWRLKSRARAGIPPGREAEGTA